MPKMTRDELLQKLSSYADLVIKNHETKPIDWRKFDEMNSVRLEIMDEFAILNATIKNKDVALEAYRAEHDQLCALAERCAAAENNFDELKDYIQKQNVRIIELETDISKLQEAFNVGRWIQRGVGFIKKICIGDEKKQNE